LTVLVSSSIDAAVSSSELACCFGARRQIVVAGRDLARRRRDGVGGAPDVAYGCGQVLAHGAHGKQQAGAVAFFDDHFPRKIAGGNGMRHFDGIPGFSPELPHDVADQPEDDRGTQQHRHQHERQRGQQHLPAVRRELGFGVFHRGILGLDELQQALADAAPERRFFPAHGGDGRGLVAGGQAQDLALYGCVLLAQREHALHRLAVRGIRGRQGQGLAAVFIEVDVRLLEVCEALFVGRVQHHVAQRLAALQPVGVHAGRGLKQREVGLEKTFKPVLGALHSRQGHRDRYAEKHKDQAHAQDDFGSQLHGSPLFLDAVTRLR
jgi:hypothetical protein